MPNGDEITYVLMSEIDVNGVVLKVKDAEAQSAIALNNIAISKRINDLNTRLEAIENPSYSYANVQVDWNESDVTSYSYIQNKPDLSHFLTQETQPDWEENDTTSAAYIQNKPDLSHFLITETKSNWNETNTSSAAYIQNKPNIPDDSNLVHKTGNETISGIKTFYPINNDDSTEIRITYDSNNHPIIEIFSRTNLGNNWDWLRYTVKGEGGETLQQALDKRNNVQSDWNQTVTTADDYIKNKPTIPAAQIQADWNQTITTAKDYIQNKPPILKDGVNLSITNTGFIEIRNDDKNIEITATDDDIKLNAGGKAYYNNNEIATKNDIPTVPTVSATVTQNDTNPVSGGAVYSKFEDLIGSAPAALDTLQEIATALNNDADLAGTLTTQISSKIPKVSNPTTDNFASFNSDGTIKDSGHSHSDYITSIKTVNNESLVGTGNIVVSGLPQVSAADNGKILMVVNGQWQLVSPSVLYTGQGVPNNAQGNNGDLYMQTD